MVLQPDIEASFNIQVIEGTFRQKITDELEQFISWSLLRAIYCSVALKEGLRGMVKHHI